MATIHSLRTQYGSTVDQMIILLSLVSLHIIIAVHNDKAGRTIINQIVHSNILVALNLSFYLFVQKKCTFFVHLFVDKFDSCAMRGLLEL